MRFHAPKVTLVRSSTTPISADNKPPRSSRFQLGRLPLTVPLTNLPFEIQEPIFRDGNVQLLQKL